MNDTTNQAISCLHVSFSVIFDKRYVQPTFIKPNTIMKKMWQKQQIGY